MKALNIFQKSRFLLFPRGRINGLQSSKGQGKPQIEDYKYLFERMEKFGIGDTIDQIQKLQLEKGISQSTISQSLNSLNTKMYLLDKDQDPEITELLNKLNEQIEQFEQNEKELEKKEQKASPWLDEKPLPKELYQKYNITEQAEKEREQIEKDLIKSFQKQKQSQTQKSEVEEPDTLYESQLERELQPNYQSIYRTKIKKQK